MAYVSSAAPAFGGTKHCSVAIEPGTAADIIKVAMINVYGRLRREGLQSRMLLQVHDELVIEVAAGEREAVEAVVRDEMGSAITLSVPLEVSVGFGRSWDDAAH